jgi:hypothetical protein
MDTVSGIFHFRWILWGIGVAGLILCLSGMKRGSAHEIKGICNRYYSRIILLVCLSFFGFSLLEKYTQFWSLSLHGQDFWLFVDILEQMKQGAFFLTRFAPHEIGYVQHGAVHPMFSWGLLLPLSFLIGSAHAALVHNPLVLSLAGLMVALLTRKSWEAWGSILWTCAFLGSTQVGKVLLYEVHPESAYPFFMLLWFWSVGLDGTHRIRYWALILSTALCMGVKEDSFLVLGPWLAWGLFVLAGQQRRAVLYSLVIATACFGFQLYAVRNWASGHWGPHEWNGSPVLYQVSLGFFKGLHWSSLSNVKDILLQFVSDQGGGVGWAKSLFHFLLSRPWLSLLVLAPWVLFQFRFWWVSLPLIAAYSVLEGPRLLWNYYSAPFLGLFWFSAAAPDRERSGLFRVWPVWAFLASCLLGSGSIDLFFPSQKVTAIKKEVKELLPCLGEAHHGLVASHLLSLVPLEKVWTERVPKTPTQWESVDFVLFSPHMSRFELPREAAEKLYLDLKNNPAWTQLSAGCLPVIENIETINAQGVVLFIHKI